ncbi:MAG: Gfo/Idh/MocA family oxidoreductase [Planctomycetota bacterium]|jgi:predicted dehydrogenase
MTARKNEMSKKNSSASHSNSLANSGDLADWSRRDFLKHSSAALAGMTLASHSVTAVNTVPKKIHIGVVGGGFGTAFQWHKHPDCIVEAVSDLRSERRKRLMETYNCPKAYNSLEELVLDKNIDAVAIFTEGTNHVKHTVEAMKHGKHVISAVPACWATLEEAQLLLDTVNRYGLSYMMAETSYYRQSTISVRKFFRQGRFGEIFYCQAEYQHAGIEALYFEIINGRRVRTWRYGTVPMHYPTHATGFLVGVTGERLTEVVCHGWGDNDPIRKDNIYNNPFWNESAMFKTNRGNAFRANIWRRGAHRGTERAEWIGVKMSFYDAHPNGIGPIIIRADKHRTEKDDAGFVRHLPRREEYKQPQWWQTDMLPEPLRHNSGHGGSHTFLTHEFIDALTHGRPPAVDVYESLAYTVPGIVAHDSAMQGGALKKIPQFDRPAKT